MEKFSKLDQNQRTRITDTQSQLKRCGDVVGHLSKGRSACFTKTVSYFLHAGNENLN